LIVARGVGAVLKIIHQVRDNMGGSDLPRETEMVGREHVPVQAEAEFHGVAFWSKIYF
jgi:hypothetical protein